MTTSPAGSGGDRNRDQEARPKSPRQQERAEILAARTNAADAGQGQGHSQGPIGAGQDRQPRPDARSAIDTTVTGLGYELVDVERAPRGLLRVTIDRVDGHVYPSGDSEFITVDDCELVTRQLQYALEVDGVAYERLEVSSPGLDRPLKTEAHFERFAGQQVSITLKVPFQGRKVFKGLLAPRCRWCRGLDVGFRRRQG